MKISKFLLPILSLSTVAFFAGCASTGYSKFYNENTPVMSKLATNKEWFVELADGEEPKIISTDDLAKDIKSMVSKRYIQIGSSNFNGKLEGVEAVQNQAKKVRAVAAIYTSKYTDTQTNSGTLLLPQTNYYSGNVNAYNGYNSGYATYNGTSTSTMAVPYSNTQRRFDQTAVFFIKYIQPMKIGMFALEIPREKRIEIGRNGMLVDLIYEDTPAYKSNLIVGDIIVEVDGKQVEDKKSFDEFIKDVDVSKGFCDFKVLRNGVEQIVRIKFS